MVKFQYNKVSMQDLQKQLKIRVAALPTLKSKEAYLRITIKKEKQARKDLIKKAEKLRAGINESQRLFGEFPDNAVSVASVSYTSDNVAGITVPMLDEIRLENHGYSTVMEPAWFVWGRRMVAELLRIRGEMDVAQKRIAMLEYARKKTTQKVNLYEKVQVPEFSASILKIKRYLEDVDNLEKAAQKITKARHNSGTEVA